MTAKKSTQKIVLHAQDFEIKADRISLVSDIISPPAVNEVKLNDTYNFLTIALDKELAEGSNYTLTVPFFGNLVKGLDGVYISSYVNKKTQKTE